MPPQVCLHFFLPVISLDPQTDSKLPEGLSGSHTDWLTLNVGGGTLQPHGRCTCTCVSVWYYMLSVLSFRVLISLEDIPVLLKYTV